MYTKGKWRVMTGNIATVVGTDSGKTAIVYGGSDEEELANAHLIAAAPDMYEACNAFKMALAIWQQDPSKAPITLATIFKETIGKALAKVDNPSAL